MDDSVRTGAEEYSLQQRLVGIVALTLPLATAFVSYIFFHRRRLLDSISAYYYTQTGNYFVGSLFALAVVFFTYHSRSTLHYRWDAWFGKIAACLAVLVALCPTKRAGDSHTGSIAVGDVHVVSACCLFVVLALFSLIQFTKTADEVVELEKSRGGDRRRKSAARVLKNLKAAPTVGKRRRNIVYRVGGWTIVGSIAWVCALNCEGARHNRSHSIFWPESVAVIAFGGSWLVKSGWLSRLIPWLSDGNTRTVVSEQASTHELSPTLTSQPLSD